VKAAGVVVSIPRHSLAEGTGPCDLGSQREGFAAVFPSVDP
jgi:hypothetical protein